MAHETLACAEGIAPERLSALRDETLPAAEATRLRAHVAACGACRARLADYDTLTAALRQQRELEPDERIVDGVRARLAEEAQPRMRLRLPTRSSRRVWAGLAALAPVAAIILLFVYVFSGLAGRGRPATANTPTAHATTTTPGPTATTPTDSLPPMTPAVSAQTAWGAISPSAAFITPLSPQKFVPQALAPDGQTLAGVQEPAQQATNGVSPHITLGTYDALTHQFAPTGPTWDSYPAAGAAISVDSHFIVYSATNGPQETCGQCHETLNAYDRQSGARWEFDPSPQQSGASLYEGVQQVLVSNDHVAFLSMEGQVWIADLAAHQVTLALPVGPQPASASSVGPEIRLLGFTWPDLMYSTQSGSSATALDVFNLQTGVNTTTGVDLAPLLASSDPKSVSVGLAAAYLVNNTLYIITNTTIDTQSGGAPVTQVSYGSLYSFANSFAGKGHATLLARWRLYDNTSDGAPTINARLITLGGGYVWDLAEGRLVNLVSAGLTPPIALALSGDYLFLLGPIAASYPGPYGPAQQVAVYDTTRFATR